MKGVDTVASHIKKKHMVLEESIFLKQKAKADLIMLLLFSCFGV